MTDDDEYATALRALRHGDGWEGDVYDVYTVVGSGQLLVDESPDLPGVVASALIRVFEEGRMRSRDGLPVQLHLSEIGDGLRVAAEPGRRCEGMALAQQSFRKLVLG